jgi:hypothetical protein
MSSVPTLNDAQRGATDAIRENGFAWLPAAQLRQLLPNAMNDKSGWDAFAASWHQLSIDTYMADGGRYRRRRFAAFAVSGNEIVRKPHQPHYQSRDYNPLNGGIERWFDPILDTIATHSMMQSCLRMCHTLFESLTPAKMRPDSWHVEAHQFRIEAKPGQSAQPTPEGLHRDGVDWVLVLLIARENIAEGVTTIFDLNKQPLGSFTLTSPLDAAFVDDSRVYHGVTAVQPLDAEKPAYRDVLVVTFRRP